VPYIGDIQAPKQCSYITIRCQPCVLDRCDCCRTSIRHHPGCFSCVRSLPGQCRCINRRPSCDFDFPGPFLKRKKKKTINIGREMEQQGLGCIAYSNIHNIRQYICYGHTLKRIPGDRIAYLEVCHATAITPCRQRSQ
jgi:hypothetical protein